MWDEISEKKKTQTIHTYEPFSWFVTLDTEFDLIASLCIYTKYLTLIKSPTSS